MKQLRHASLIVITLLTILLVTGITQAQPSSTTPLTQISPLLLPLVRRPYVPLWIGLFVRWDGTGFIRSDAQFDAGIHITRTLDTMTDSDTVRCRYDWWYSPNPAEFDSGSSTSYYSISTGHIKYRSSPSDPDWKWGAPWVLPYNWTFQNGQTVRIDGKRFTVTGPHSGYTAFGQAIQYWQLINRNKFVYWDAGGNWQQYVHPGDINLRYDAGRTRLLLHRDVIRREYYKGKQTTYTIQYIYNLTSSTAFPNSPGIAESQPINTNQQPKNRRYGTPLY